MPARYVVKNTGVSFISSPRYKIEDTKEHRTICHCYYIADANHIAKAMNVSDSWDPILMTNEMGPSNYIKKEGF